MTASPKTIYTKRGYAIVKHKFGFKDIHSCKQELTVTPFVNDDYAAKVSPFPIYLESDKKLYLPKHYGFKKFGNPDEVKISKGTEINVQFNGTLKEIQIPIVNAFMLSCNDGDLSKQSNGGIISVPCGVGKTICALNIISRINRKTLVVVHKGFLMSQWERQIQNFLPSARIGVIQGSKIDIKDKDIVIAMLQSISMKEYEPGTFDDFGLTIIDECHHIAAEVFSRALPKLNSYYSLGLSATPNRPDGLSKVFHMYLGPMIYRIEKRDDKKVRVNKIKFYDKDNKNYTKEELTSIGKLCVSRMINNISDNFKRNVLINSIIKNLVEEGRKILVLSDRREHLNLFYELVKSYATVGYYIGGMKQRALDISEKCQVILGTYPMSSEGLDIPDLDSVIFTTPKSNIEQSIGRIIRKNHSVVPLAFDIVDMFSVFSRQYEKRDKIYRKLEYEIYELTVDKLPSEIKDTLYFTEFLKNTDWKQTQAKQTKSELSTNTKKKKYIPIVSDELDTDNENQSDEGCLIEEDD